MVQSYFETDWGDVVFDLGILYILGKPAELTAL